MIPENYKNDSNCLKYCQMLFQKLWTKMSKIFDENDREKFILFFKEPLKKLNFHFGRKIFEKIP